MVSVKREPFRSQFPRIFSMKLSIAVITSAVSLYFAHPAQSAESRNYFQIGQSDYNAGEFKSAISRFEQARRMRPKDPAVHFWLGKSYEMLAIINGPLFDRRPFSKAHQFLAEAVQLAPEDREYRRELFDFLIEFDSSPHALHEADDLLQSTNESDPDYPFMQLRLHEAHQARRSPEFLAGAVFVSVPGNASAWHSR
jgi:tetratricopeptide (TPR) repeat protein